MVIKSLFFFIFLFGQAYACSLNRGIVSLSGPVTMVLEELDLLEDKKLKGISSFHPIGKKTSAKIIAGGLFLSKKTLTDFKGSVVFYDKSFELARVFKKSGLKEVIDLDTVGLSSFKVVDKVQNLLKPYLVNCQKKLGDMNFFLGQSRKTIKKMKKLKALFYLGLINRKKPEMIMVNDGFVMSLKDLKVLKTYESELAYVQWSAKEMKKYKDYLSFGVSDFINGESRFTKLADKKYNIFFRGVLIPGIRQIYFMNELARLSFSKSFD